MKPHHYDIIGDIHGHADTLRALLAKLGYVERDGAYQHPEHRAIFVGDFIDRGPKIRETLRLVRGMVESGDALAVMGNHEFNAIRYHTGGPDGKPLRPRSKKVSKQHRATLEQLAIPHPEEWADWLAWFKTLPLFLDLGGLRVVHAAWCRKSVGVVAKRGLDDEAFLLAASTPGHADFNAVRTLLNGPEISLPAGHCFYDKEGHAHSDLRVRWFGPRPVGWPATYRSMVFPPNDEAPEIEVSSEALAATPVYGEGEPPVIFGHYWMPPVSPCCLARNVACVDYSVASQNGGLLTAYRWSGESVLSDANLVSEARA